MDESFPLSFSESDKGKTLPLTCKEIHVSLYNFKGRQKFEPRDQLSPRSFYPHKNRVVRYEICFSLSSTISDITISHCSVNMNYKLLKAVVVYN